MYLLNQNNEERTRLLTMLLTSACCGHKIYIHRTMLVLDESDTVTAGYYMKISINLEQYSHHGNKIITITSVEINTFSITHNGITTCTYYATPSMRHMALNSINRAKSLITSLSLVLYHFLTKTRHQCTNRRILGWCNLLMMLSSPVII